MKRYEKQSIEEDRIVSNTKVKSAISGIMNDAISTLKKKFDMSQEEAIKSIEFYLKS